jgi:uncharacterized protein YbjQ (UPF0145 family)
MRADRGTFPAVIALDAVVTFEKIDGFRVVKSFGYAYGQASRPRNVIRSTFRHIGAFIGLMSSVEYLTEAERVRSECLLALVAKAGAMGANGVVGLQFQASEQRDGSTRVLAFGEAVLLEPTVPA